MATPISGNAPKFSNQYLNNIGVLPGLNEYTDPDGAFGNYKKNLMRIVDVIPVYYTLNVSNIFKENQVTPENIIDMDFIGAIEEYKLKLKAVGLNDHTEGIRIWTTNETSSQDSITNEFKENKLVETYDSMLTAVSQMPGTGYARGAGFRTKPGNGSLNGGVADIAAALIDGRQLSLPRIWQKSDYNPVLSLTFKLNTPYGGKTSFQKNIAEPLIRTLALVSPSSYDGMTYGLPPFVLIRAYGVAYMSLATPDSVSIIRGGGDGRVNRYKQPLEITVTMSFKPALPGFAALLSKPGTSNIATNIDQVNVPVGNEDGTSKMVPGITTLGSIIESLRPIGYGAQILPVTFGSLGMNTDPNTNTDISNNITETPSVSIRNNISTFDNIINKVIKTPSINIGGIV